MSYISKRPTDVENCTITSTCAGEYVVQVCVRDCDWTFVVKARTAPGVYKLAWDDGVVFSTRNAARDAGITWVMAQLHTAPEPVREGV